MLSRHKHGLRLLQTQCHVDEYIYIIEAIA
jgi:hypothetical protein